MIKSELIAQLAEENPHLYQKDIEKLVSTFFEVISQALEEGNRVELKGIESKIRLISSVKNCLVEYSKKSKKIVALIESSKRLKTNFMHKHLVDNLPHYMIPKTFIFTKKFQLNRSGKIDKNYLRKKYL